MARGDEYRGAVGDGRARVAGRSCSRGYTIADSMSDHCQALRRQSGVDTMGNGERGLYSTGVRNDNNDSIKQRIYVEWGTGC